MVEEVLGVIAKWQSNERLTSLGEAMVQQVIVLPILRRLGWDPDNDHEVYPQYPVADRWVDYALLIGNAPKVFIEVKKGGEPLEKHQDQLLDYSFKQGVKIAALTNGGTWWFYLPLREGSWEERRFHVAEFDKQNADEIAQRFVDLLSKENVCSRAAIQNAEGLYKRLKIEEALPKAWNQLVNGTIVDLLTTRTEKLCGHSPDRNTVEQFLSSHLQQIQIIPQPAPVSPVEPHPSPKPSPSGSMNGKKIKEFTFCGHTHKVTAWIRMLVRLCELVYSAKESRFDEVLNLRATPRSEPWFSKNSKDFPKFKPIDKTGIVVNSNKTPNEIVVIAKHIITHFGYNEDDLSFDID